jgi:malate/lactate dehydrogenase
MKLTIIGVGNLGAAISNAAILTQEGLLLSLYEPYKGNIQRAKAEWGDLYPVARARGNRVLWAETKGHKLAMADAFIITSGQPRTKQDTDKSEWLKRVYPINLGIVMEVVNKLPDGARIFIATNPPKEIAAKLRELGYNAHELRTCTDRLRTRYLPNGYSKATLNNLVIGG